jgi:drug/metabolite transporter (DMT)-like permease
MGVDKMTTQLWAIALVLLGDFIGSFASILLKIGSGSITRNIRGIIANYRRTMYLFIGLGMYGVSAIIFTFALKGGELSVLYPFVAVVYIFTTILSRLILKEKITKWKALGIAFITLGVIFIGFGGG